MTDNHADRTGRLPQRVVDAVQAFVDQLHGRGDGFDVDELDDDTFDAVSALLPLVAEAVLTGGHVPLDGVPDWEGSRALAELGLVPASGKARLSGTAVRQLRESAKLTTAEAAMELSARGYTCTSDFFDEVEARPGSPVAPEVAELVAATFGVDVADVIFDDTVAGADRADATPSEPTVPAEIVTGVGAAGDATAAVDGDGYTAADLVRSVADEIFWARPDVKIAAATTPAGGPAILGALTVTRLGLVAKVIVFDDDAPGVERAMLHAAEQVLVADPDVALVFAVRTDDERSTQAVDATDLAASTVTTTGRPFRSPHRPVLALGDAIRSALEELLPMWDDIDVAGPTATSLDAAEVATAAAFDAFARITAARVSIEVKKEANVRVGRRTAELGAALGDLVASVRSGVTLPSLVARQVKELAEAS